MPCVDQPARKFRRLGPGKRDGLEHLRLIAEDQLQKLGVILVDRVVQ